MPTIVCVGDIVAIQGRGFLANGIRKATHSDVSHVGMVIGAQPPIVIEALTRVRTRPLADTIASADAAWLLHDGRLQDAQRATLVKEACRFSADGYGYADLPLQWLDCISHTRVFTHKLGWFLNTKPICSFVVASAYHTIGAEFGVSVRSATPGDILAYARLPNSGFTVTQIK